MKVLDVSEVLDGIDRWVEKKEQEKEQVHAIREAMKKVIELDDNLKGRGGEAIKKHFANHHLPIINEWLQFLDDYTNRLNGIKNEILDFETNEAIIREDFLEHDIKNGLDKLARFTHDKVNEINETFFSISDLIGGAPISTAEFDSEIHNSGRYLHETIHQLRDLDEKSVSKVTSAAHQLEQLIQLMENKRRPTKSGTILKQRADNPFIAFAEGLGDILPFNVWADSIVHPIHTLEEMWKAWKKEVLYGNAVSRAAFFGKLIGNYHFINEVISNTGSRGTRLTKEEQEVDNLLKKFNIADKIEHYTDISWRATKGLVAGAGHAAKDMVTDTFNMVMHPRETLEAIDYADQHRIETAIYAGAAIYASWKRDIVNGDAYSRAEYVGNVAAQIVIPYGEFKLALKISDITRVSRLKALGKLKAAKDKSVEFVQRVKRIRLAPKTIMITPEGLHVPANEFVTKEELWQRFSNGPDAPDVNNLIHGGGGKGTGNGNIVNEVKEIDFGKHIIKGENGKKQLLPNTKYVTNDNYKYTTDKLGRIVNVDAPELVLKKANRNKYAQANVGGKDRLPDDDGGHLIGAQFNGPPDIDNLVPQNSQINRRGGVWYEMETEWANALKEVPPKKVSVSIEPIYSNNSMRPVSFMVEYEIEGQFPVIREIENKSGG